MKKQQQGFTLIELMIVVAIIGILAAIAIPSYMDYTKKAKVSEMILATAPYKMAVAETYADSLSFPTDNTSAGAANFVGTDVVTSVAIASGGVITAAADGTNVGALSIVLTPDASTSGITWVCSAAGGDARLAPSSCR